jgi:hypothetical protein
MSGFEDDFGEMVEPASAPVEGSGGVMEPASSGEGWERWLMVGTTGLTMH